MEKQLSLDAKDAARLVDAATKAAKKLGVPQNVAVADQAGNLLMFVRMDGAKWMSGEIAINKAFTAAGTRTSTAEIATRTQPGEAGWMIQNQYGGRFTTLGGGLPVQVGKRTVGAIGISGGSVAEDIEVANAAVAEFSRDR